MERTKFITWFATNILYLDARKLTYSDCPTHWD